MAASSDLIIDYYTDGESLWQDEHADAVPVIGQGVHLDGVFYRIVDIWMNYEKRAPVNYGIAVFLEKTPTPAVYQAVDATYYKATPTAPPPAPRAVTRDPDDPNVLTQSF